MSVSFVSLKYFEGEEIGLEIYSHSCGQHASVHYDIPRIFHNLFFFFFNNILLHFALTEQYKQQTQHIPCQITKELHWLHQHTFGSYTLLFH